MPQHSYLQHSRRQVLASCIAAACVLLATHPAGAADAESRFREWASLATAQTLSPATPQAGDQVVEWTAPDQRKVRLVVRAPHPLANAPTLTLPAVPDGEDASPVFDKALLEARRRGVSGLIVPRGRYVFRSLVESGSAHLNLAGQSDFTLEGNGSTFVFTQDKVGIQIKASQRLRIRNLNIEYALRMASLGQVRDSDQGKILVIDSRYPVGSDDAVRYLSEYDPAQRRWVPGGERLILNRSDPRPVTFAGNQTYRSAAFAELSAGKNYVVMHHFYGGNAIRIEDRPREKQAEDITLDGISIYSAPGMGIVASGLKRGLAVLNCRVARKPDATSLVSTEYDAIHIAIAGGDILLAGNDLSGQGDDAINLSSPVHTLSAIDRGGRRAALADDAGHISRGDTLAFFDDQAGYLGQAIATDSSRGPEPGKFQVSWDKAVEGLGSRSVARDLALTTRRYVIRDNQIHDCYCHGLLAQGPNGLIEGNTIERTLRNGVRLLAGVGRFKEGTGAMNVIVRNNRIADTGPDPRLDLPWGAISAYSVTGDNEVSRGFVNLDLDISGNSIRNVAQGCITIASSLGVSVSDNRCESSNLSGSPEGSLNVLKSAAVRLSGNQLDGKSSGGLKIDRATTSRVEVPAAD